MNPVPKIVSTSQQIVRIGRLFLTTTGIILAVTGAAKVYASTGQAPLLETADPLLGLPFRQVILIFGLVELAIACLCFWRSLQRGMLVVVAWLSTLLLLYRLGVWLVGWKSPCSCLGGLADALRLSQTTADNIAKLLLAYLLLGSYFLIFRGSLRRGSYDQVSVANT